MSEYCSTVRRTVVMEPVAGTTAERCPECGLVTHDQPSTGDKAIPGE